MIPISLSLKNFMSYGEDVPALDFSGFHVACVCGRNGHGKSALLDAITWALWGEARKARNERKPDEGLLRIGTTEMKVEFVFELEDVRYRVTRSYRKTGKSGTTWLEFQIFRKETQDYKTLSERGSIGKTQKQLNTRLRMGYDTFINSAFILQGRADEFTKRGARERKDILGNILGLSRYDDLAALARKHSEKADAEIAKVQERLEEIDEAIIEKPDLDDEIKAVSAELKIVEHGLKEFELSLETFRKAHARAEGHHQEMNSLCSERARLNIDKDDNSSQGEVARRELAACQKILDREDEILAAAKQHHTLQEEEAILRQKLNSLRVLEKRQNELDKVIADKRHEVERRLAEWQVLVGEMEREISQAKEILEGRSEVERGMAELEEARKKEQELEGMRSKVEALERQVRDLERVHEKACSAIQVDLRSLRERQQDFEATVSQIPQLRGAAEEAHAKWEEAQELDAKLRGLLERGSAFKAQIETTQNLLPGLAKDLKKVEQQQASLRDIADTRCPLCGSDLDEEHRAEVQSQLDDHIQTINAEIVRIEAQIQTFEAEREHFNRPYWKAANRLSALDGAAQSAAQAQAALEAAEEADNELEQVREKVQTTKARLQEVERDGPEALALIKVRTEMEGLPYDILAHCVLRDKIRKLRAVEVQMAQIKGEEERLQKAEGILPERIEKRDLASTWINEKRYAGPLQAEVDQVKADIAILGYDSVHHQQVTANIEVLREAAAQRERLESAEREMSGAQSRLAAAEKREREIDARMQQIHVRMEEVETIIQEGIAVARQIKDIEGHVLDVRPRRDLLLEERAGLQARYDRCAAQEETRGAKAALLQQTGKASRTYKDLVTAFGKDGIQALIIEQAIPEIEEDANRILGRLTGNRSQIALESLRDLKKGGTRETLDIEISDELGQRRYELYSGGEAFRVDFSIRIALSKLLARRAGTRLRTLVIDEGFGTQDAEGLDHLVEAIQAISDDFEKILVITHVEALKQAFPVRIEVVKYQETGSRFEIVY